MDLTPSDRRFRVGELTITDAAEAALDEVDLNAGHFLAQFVQLDWGSIDEAQREVNEQAIKNGEGEIRGVYKTVLGTELAMVTSQDWRRTVLMLASENGEPTG